MATVQMAGNGFGGLVQGNFGNYQAATDGTFTIDTRDVPSMLALGMTYVNQQSGNYTTPAAPAAATIGGVVASGALSNGTVAVTTQPVVMRPVNLEIGTGTGAITAGTVTVSYVGNDGILASDTFSAVCPASSSVTQSLSRGVDTISLITVAGVTGGTSPWIRLSTTAAISLPVSPNTVDFFVRREYDAGATVAVGTPVSALASLAPTTPPNGTVTYSFVYSFVAPSS